MNSSDEHEHKPAPLHGIKLFLSVLGGIILLLFIVGLLPRIMQKQELKKVHEETTGAIPVVHTIISKPSANTESITLPGNIGAIQYTTIYARIDGYLKDRMVDIGDTVKTGQLLATIDTPTVDQELLQARADLLKAKAELETSKSNLKEAIAKDKQALADIERAKANVAYATVTAKRWQDMCVRGAVSEQSRDEKVRSLESTSADLQANIANEQAAKAQIESSRSEINQAAANVKAKQADVAKYVAEQSFQKVLAPFDGVITYRKVDPGALITQGSQSSNLELFQLAKIDSLRIYVSVPQRIARYLRDGMTADVLVPEYPERKFVGIVTNVSGALDPNTRTRQTEIKIKNQDHALLPGMYAEIKLTTLREQPWIRVPGTTLVTRADGQFVVVIKDSKAHYQPITIGRDFGNEVEIQTGLQGNELIVVSPSDDLQEGEQVKSEPLPNEST
ncbi:MAG: efflux RND transporter periplasmic adaptor subunit [Candidatus Obscuribacterales bacterium]|nr:efflux RND transporter periplasmic adaptor subunit [Candidatus Obscuribacterales bacterium]